MGGHLKVPPGGQTPGPEWGHSRLHSHSPRTHLASPRQTRLSQVGRPTLLSSVFVCVSSQNPQPRPRVRAVTAAAGPLDSCGGRPGWGRRLLRLQ